MDLDGTTNLGDFHTDEYLYSTLDGQIATLLTLLNVVLLFSIFLFTAYIKDVTIECQRKPVFIPVRPPRGFRLYAVLLETDASAAGGTTSNVALRICGRNTNSPPFVLWCADDNGKKRTKLFQNKDLFILSLPHYLGDVEWFEVYTDREGDCPAWFLKNIRCICVDNGKCWKSHVGAWLRADTKHEFPATIVTHLTTQQYFTKVLSQNYNWMFVWSRSLGSTFKCKQRWSVLWSSICCSMTVCHFMLYDDGLVMNVLNNKLQAPVFTSNQMALAALTSSAAGVLLALILRVIVGGKVDIEGFEDDDDLAELLKCLVYEEGEVVSVPRSRTSAEMKPTYSQANLQDEEASEEVMMNELKEAIDAYISKQIEKKSKPTVDPVAGDSTTMSNIGALPMNQQMDYLSAEISKLVTTLEKQLDLPKESQPVTTKNPTDNDEKNSTSKLMNILATIAEEDNEDELTNETPKDVNTKLIMSSISRLLNRNPNSKKDPNTDDPEYYDSMSETEPNDEFVTSSQRKSVRRSKNIYNSAPMWSPKWRVWIEHSDGDQRHHARLNRRYAKTEVEVAGDHDEVIQSYCHDEQHAQHGYAKCSYVADALAFTCALVSTAALTYCIIKRLRLPNADSVIFFYAVSLMIVLHAFVFSVLDDLFCSICSVWIRRRRMLSKRSLSSA